MVGWQRRIPLGGRRVISITALGRSPLFSFPLLPGRPYFLLAHRRSWATCAELRHDGVLRSSHLALVDGIMLSRGCQPYLVSSNEDDTRAQRRARQGGGYRSSAPDLPGGPDLRPAAGQEVPDELPATHDGARPRMAAARRRGAAPGLVRVGYAPGRHAYQS